MVFFCLLSTAHTENRPFARNLLKEYSYYVIIITIIIVGDNKMKRKLLILILVAVSLAFSAAVMPETALQTISIKASAADTFTEGIYTYSVTDGEAKITSIKFADAEFDVVIPETLGGYPVVSVTATPYLSTRMVVFPECVNSVRIGSNALSFNDMTKLVIMNPNCNISQIGGSYNHLIYGYQNSTAKTYAEKNNKSFVPLEKVKTKDGYDYTIEDGKAILLWAPSDLEGDITVPSEFEGCIVSKISDGAYAKCRQITSVTIEPGVETIGYGAFNYCSELLNIDLPEGLKSIEEHSFYYCYNLVKIETPDTLEKIGASAFWLCNDLQEISLSKGIKAVGSSSFYGPYSFTKLEVRNKEFDFSTIFSSDESLSKISEDLVIYGYPDSTAQIFANENNISFQELEEEQEEILQADGFTYIINDDGTATITGLSGNAPANLLIPSKLNNISVSAIGEEVFKSNKDIVSVTISEGIKEIGKGAFSGCSSLESVSFPQSLEVVGINAFFTCTNLSGRITFSENVRDIGTGAFFGCSKVERFTVLNLDCELHKDVIWLKPFPSNATLYGFYNSTAQAYAKKNSMNFILLDEDPTSIFTYIIGESFITITGTKEPFSGDLVIPSKIGGLPVHIIADNAFQSNHNITSVEFKSGVEYIGSQAFYDCKNIKTVKLPDSVQIIYNAAFENCTALEEINIPKTVEKIGNLAFNGCNNLKSVMIYNNDCVLLEDEYNITTADRFLFSDNTVIYGHEYSNAHSYATACGKQFKSFENVYADAFDIAFADGVLVIRQTGEIPEIEDLQEYPWDKYKTQTNAIFFEDFTLIFTGAFENFENITAVIIDGAPTVVESDAFKNCNKIKTIALFADAEIFQSAFSTENIKLFAESDKQVNYPGVNPMRFSYSKNTVSFDGYLTTSSYDFFDLVAIICNKYDNVDIIRFNKFTATDFDFYYFYEDDWRFEKCKDNTLEDAEFTVKINVDGEMQSISFNALCEMVANGETLFTLVAKDRTETEIKDTDIEVKGESFFEKALAWITSLINKLLSIFSRFK